MRNNFDRVLLVIGALSVAFGPTGTAWAQRGMDYYGHYGPHMWSGGAFGWIFGPLFMLAFIAVIVVVVVLLVRWTIGPAGHGHLHAPPTGRMPLDILKERFARGEIDKEEFEERRRVLGD